MKILHLTKKDYKTSAWSGGTTTELFIWPENASYAAREFAVRISSATVELPESDFTPLPGVQRFITPLQGGFTLSHGDGAPIVMEPLDEPYGFSGGEETHCVGTATDFNLMLKGVPGSMEILQGSARIRPGINGFYATEAAIFSVENTEFSVKAGQMLLIFAKEESDIQLGAAPVICCRAEMDYES